MSPIIPAPGPLTGRTSTTPVSRPPATGASAQASPPPVPELTSVRVSAAAPIEGRARSAAASGGRAGR